MKSLKKILLSTLNGHFTKYFFYSFSFYNFMMAVVFICCLLDLNATDSENKIKRRKENLTLERKKARAIRDALKRQRKKYTEAYRQVIYKREQQKKIQRLRRIKREDPDHNTFWRIEQTAKLGKQIILAAGEDRSVVLFRNNNPLQFHGHRGFLHKYIPKLHSGIRIPPDRADITQLLLQKKGHYIILLLPESSGNYNFKKIEYELIKSVINGESYEIINIYSDGVDILLVEMELEGRDGEAGEYFNWKVERIYLEQHQAQTFTTSIRDGRGDIDLSISSHAIPDFTVILLQIE